MPVKQRHFAIVVLWITTTIASFIYLTSGRVVEFDPQHSLAQISHQEFLTKWQQISDNLPSQRSIVHFQQEGCHCNQVSERHMQTINKQASADDFAIQQVSLSPQLAKLIPSTPAIAIIDKGQLVYFGPYGEGIACSQTNGFAQTVLSNLQKGYAANLVVSNAKGCYCHT